MYRSSCNISHYLAAIEGTWYNPVTQTQFIFSCGSAGPHTITAAVVPHKAAVKSNLELELCLVNRGAEFRKDDRRYPVALAGKLVKSMHISISPGEVLRLVKQD